jgi:L-malate glycosyltransferase
MLALCQALRERNKEVKLAIASTGPGPSLERYCSRGIDCFSIPMRNKHNSKQQTQALQTCAQIVKEWKPDIIHVHGTERFFGLLSARGLISVPTVISIQGLMIPYAEWYHFFGNRSLFDIMKIHRFVEIPVMRGLLWDYHRYRKAALREREIIAGNQYFMGRTIWDQAHLHSINPAARYFHVGEMIRKLFWHARWEISQSKRHRIIFVNPGHPRKGVETVLGAADILRRDYPNLELALAGTISGRSGYGRYIRKEIKKRNEYLLCLGALNAEEMSREFLLSHVFVSPSYIENSSNAICEAQLVGMPVVSSFTGGVPSLIEDGRTGMFFPSGDAPFLASIIKKVFEDDDLAKMLSQNAHKKASNRHDPASILRELLNTYRGVIKDNLRQSKSSPCLE